MPHLLGISSDIFGKMKHVVTKLDKSILKSSCPFKTGGGGNLCTTQNQVQFFSMINCIQASEITLTTHLGHPSITAWI